MSVDFGHLEVQSGITVVFVSIFLHIAPLMSRKNVDPDCISKMYNIRS